MAGTFQYGEKAFNIDDIYLESYNALTTNFTGTIARVARPRKVEVTPVVDTDEINSSGFRTDVLTVKRAVDLMIDVAGYDFDVTAIMTGGTVTSTGTTPNQQRKYVVNPGGDGFPYFGMICVGRVEGGGLLVWGAPAVKLKNEPMLSLDGEESKYTRASMEAASIGVELTSGVVYSDVFKSYESSSSFTVPADATAFRAWFTA